MERETVFDLVLCAWKTRKLLPGAKVQNLRSRVRGRPNLAQTATQTVDGVAAAVLPSQMSGYNRLGPAPPLSAAQASSRGSRLCAAVQLVGCLVVFPLLLCLKADGTIGCTWAALWTPVWLADALMLVLACVSFCFNDLSSRIAKDFESVQWLTAFLSVQMQPDSSFQSKAVQLVKTLLFCTLQVLVICKLDGVDLTTATTPTEWKWFTIAVPWILFELLTFAHLLPSACMGSAWVLASTIPMLPALRSSGSLEWATLEEWITDDSANRQGGGAGGAFGQPTSASAAAAAAAEDQLEEITSAVVAIDASDVDHLDSADELEAILTLKRRQQQRDHGFARPDSRYVLTQQPEQSPVVLRQLERDEAKFQQTLTLRMAQNGLLVCALRLWLAFSLSAKLDNGPADQRSWSIVLAPVWVFVASQYLLAYIFRAWARALLRLAHSHPSSMGAVDSAVLWRSKQARGSRLLAAATAVCVVVTVPLVVGILVVLRYQAGFLRGEPALVVVLPLMLLLSLSCCCLRGGGGGGGGGGVANDAAGEEENANGVSGAPPQRSGSSSSPGSLAQGISKSLFHRVESLTKSVGGSRYGAADTAPHAAGERKT